MPRVPRADKLIPAPEEIALCVYKKNTYGEISLQAQMGLENDRWMVKEMTEATRKAACELFKFSPLRQVRIQRPERIQAVKDRVVKQCPYLSKYEDGWPVSRYIHIFLKNYHPPNYTGPSKRGRKPGRKVLAEQPKVSVKRARVMQKHSRPGPGRHSRGYIPEAEAESESESEDASGEDLEIHESNSHSPPGHTSSNDTHQETTAKAHSVVHAFLTNLKLPLGDIEGLTRVFEDMGIKTQDYLELFASMETRDTWLRELKAEGKITDIQMRLVREGLERMQSEIATRKA